MLPLCVGNVLPHEFPLCIAPMCCQVLPYVARCVALYVPLGVASVFPICDALRVALCAMCVPYVLFNDRTSDRFVGLCVALCVAYVLPYVFAN